MVWTEFIWLRIVASGGNLENGNVLLDLITCWEMVDQLISF